MERVGGSIFKGLFHTFKRKAKNENDTVPPPENVGERKHFCGSGGGVDLCQEIVSYFNGASSV